jgi:integrase
LGEICLEHQSKSVGYKTSEDYENAFKHLADFYDCNIEDITPLAFQNLLERLADKHYSFSAISKVKTVFGLILKYTIVYENINLVNYMSSIRIPKRAPKGTVTAPPDEAIDIITKNATTTDFGMWAMIMLCTGWRRGELAALQKKNIDFHKDIISLKHSVEFRGNTPYVKDKPKTESSIRYTPILDMLKPILFDFCKDMKDDDFVFGGNSPLTKSMIRKRWAKYCKTSGYTFNGHQLRHAYALLLYRSGVDAKTAQHLLGHSDVKITMNIYTQFDKEVTQSKVVKMNDYLNYKYGVKMSSNSL